jgi:superfamily I DNA/RNA helicase
LTIQYFAITQETCSWLLARPKILAALHDELTAGEFDSLRKSDFSTGPFRLASDSNGTLIAAWNRDYLGGTGHEAWGILKLAGGMGLLDGPAISQQVLERSIYVFNQRLQGLIVDSEFIHRMWSNGSQTCLAGRGTEARQKSICYFEGTPGSNGLHARAIVSVGPSASFDELQAEIVGQMPKLAQLAAASDSLLDTKRKASPDSGTFGKLRLSLTGPQQEELKFDKVKLNTISYDEKGKISPYETIHWTYDQWISSKNLNEAQYRILYSDVLSRHPVRVVGPAGSGKTLLMQMLAIRHIRSALDAGKKVRILYIVHNAPMAITVSDRLRTLWSDYNSEDFEEYIKVVTLSEYGRQVTGLTEEMIIDKNAHETKLFQLKEVQKALRNTLDTNSEKVGKSVLLSQVRDNDGLFSVFSELVMVEISNAIKGRGLFDDEKRYVNSDTPFSRLHGILTTEERSIIYETFRKYHISVFEQFEVLDSDDIAISLLGRLRTPLWELKRKREGFDFIFVDEAQLFNENERRIFSFLSNGLTAHVPIALALDEAQDAFAFSSAGLATLGIAGVENENLPSNHRSTKEIVDLSFYIIQQTTDLFSADFPDFEKIEQGMVPSDHALANSPTIVRCSEDQKNFGKFIVKQVQKHRSDNLRQVAVICHAESYWSEILQALNQSQLPIHIVQQRGEKITPDQPLVILSRPSFVGGQEFDAVLSVGLEQGVVPPRIVDNPTLAAAVEQQVLREMYLSITRARYRYVVLLNRGTISNSIIASAQANSLISYPVS